MLTGVALCHSSGYYGGGSTWSLVSHYHSLGWLCIILRVILLVTGKALCHLRCLTVTHRSGLVSSEVCCCWSLKELFVILGVLLLLTGVSPCNPRCPKAAFCGCFVSFQVTYSTH